MSTKKYPIGVNDFSEIIEKGYRYVDKTAVIYDLVHRYSYVFLNRPQGFGKSLMVSTMRCYFEGRKELFKGLAISQLETEWVKHPVLRFDLSAAECLDAEQTEDLISSQLARYEEIYGRNEHAIGCNLRLDSLVRRASKLTGQHVALFIDGYDAPLLNVLDDKEKYQAINDVITNFFAPIKSLGEYLKFFILTGITRYIPQGIFSSVLNNLKHISTLPNYAAICGITSEELATQFSDDVDDFAARLGVSRDEALKELQENYGGYHFAEDSPEVFNPHSLISALSDGRCGHYAKTPACLTRLMRKLGKTFFDLDYLKYPDDIFNAPIESMHDVTPMLYQCGYLTIQKYSPVSMSYTLGIPNEEMREGFNKFGSHSVGNLH